MKFYKDEKLTTEQLFKRLGICKRTFQNRKIDLLYDLSHFCKYEILREGRSEIYHFLEDSEYIYCRKNSKEMKERDAIYEKAIIQILTDQPLNTAANVSRIAKEKIPEISQLGYADATNYEYIRVRMRKWFGKDEHDLPLFGEESQRKGYIDHKTWCYLDAATNIYVPLTEEQIADLKNIFQKYFGKGEEKSLILASALDDAAARLKNASFKLWIYLAKNQDKYRFGLSQTAFCNWASVSKPTYLNAVKDLIEKGYLVLKEEKSHTYIFYERPTIKTFPKTEEDLIIENNSVKDFQF